MQGNHPFWCWTPSRLHSQYHCCPGPPLRLCPFGRSSSLDGTLAVAVPILGMWFPVEHFQPFFDPYHSLIWSNRRIPPEKFHFTRDLMKEKRKIEIEGEDEIAFQTCRRVALEVYMMLHTNSENCGMEGHRSPARRGMQQN